MSIQVLLIDDSKIIRTVIQRVFAVTGIPVSRFIEAGDGLQGLEALKRDQFDVIFLDVNMPVMDGVQFMEALYKDPTLSSAPVIVVSTEGSDERKNDLFRYGVKTFVRKPVTPEQLSEAIATYVQGGGREKV
jgi:two-component system chemotaxis response regulator CheY